MLNFFWMALRDVREEGVLDDFRFLGWVRFCGR